MTVQRGLFFKALLTCALLLAGCGGDPQEKTASELAHIAVKGDASIWLSTNWGFLVE